MYRPNFSPNKTTALGPVDRGSYFSGGANHAVYNYNLYFMSDPTNNYNFGYGDERSIGWGSGDVNEDHASYALGDHSVPVGLAI